MSIPSGPDWLFLQNGKIGLNAFREDTKIAVFARIIMPSSTPEETSDSSIKKIKRNWLEVTTLVYLLAPHFLFFVGWIRDFWALLACFSLSVILFIAIHSYLQGSYDDKNNVSIRPTITALLVCLAIALALASLSGAGGVGGARQDWIKHYAILKDLMIQHWPVSWDIGSSGDCRLVYYLGYYLVPSFIGKFTGWAAANACLFSSTVIGVWLTLAWYCRLSGCKSAYSAFWISTLFVLSGGWDLIGHIIEAGLPFHIRDLFESWSPVGIYDSNTNGLFWAPQHSIGGWLVTALTLDQYYLKRKEASVVVPLVAALCWTPFAAIGLFPFSLMTFAKNRNINLSKTISIILSLFILVLFATYYGSLSKPPTWLFSPSKPTWWLDYITFFFLEVGVYLILLGSLWKIQGKECETDFNLVLVLSITLLVIPFFSVGVNNDFVLRASIPSLFTMRVLIGQALLYLARRQQKKIMIMFLFVISLGAIVPLMDISRSIRFWQYSVPELESVKSVPNCTRYSNFYLGDRKKGSFFFRYFARDP